MFEFKDILNMPVVKVFAMTDVSNHPFVVSFHSFNSIKGIYFKVTPNRLNPITKVPVYEGTCYSVNAFIDILTTYGCKYIKRLPISKGELLSKDYLDGLADGLITAKPKTETTCSCHCKGGCSNKKENSKDFLDKIFKQLEEGALDFELPF